MTLYATLAYTKQMMEAQDSTGDAELLRLIRQVSRRIDRLFAPTRRAPFFAPFIETRNNLMLQPDQINSHLGTYDLRMPILALTAVSVGTQALTVGSIVQLFQGDAFKYRNLQLIDRCCNGWYQYVRCAGCVEIPFVSVTGTWGYNIDWPNAWVDTLQTITNVGGMNSSVTSFTVTDLSDPDDQGNAPCISAGNLLQIESEWLEVTATDTATNTVTVKRGVNGSTAAAHAQSTVIYTYLVDEAVQRATARQAAFQYAKLGAYDNKAVSGIGTVDFAPDVLYEFSTLLSLFSNW